MGVNLVKHMFMLIMLNDLQSQIMGFLGESHIKPPGGHLPRQAGLPIVSHSLTGKGEKRQEGRRERKD